MSERPVPKPAGDASEADAVRARYAQRAQAQAGAQADPGPGRYSFLQPDVWQSVHERQRAMLRLFARLGWARLDDKRVLEVGCGSGGNLLELLRMGFAPAHLAGVELLTERFAQARAALPPAVALWLGDATADAVAQAMAARVPAGSQQLVLQSTVFSSLLDDDFQQQLAAQMWRWVAPGGGVLWYDFAVSNPRNPDVRGVPMARVRALFPQARPVLAQRVTLAPPLARALCRLHPALYRVANALPLLRTHRLVWLGKPASG